MENNIFNMNNMSKETIRKAAKYEKAAADFLKEHDESLKNELAAKEQKALNEAMSAARFSSASAFARSKARVNKLNEEIAYTNDSSIIGMTEMAAEVVEKALLLDEEEFERIHPGYKQEIRDTIRGLLENAEVEENISNPKTLTLMEYVAATLPSVKEGVCLTEDELSSYISSKKSINVDSAISQLAGNVSSRVASLMEKEQKKIEAINNEIEEATGVPVDGGAEEMPVDENGNPIDPNAMAAEEPMVDENGNPIDPNAMVDENGNPIQPGAEEMPVDENGNPIDPNAMVDENGNPIDPAAMAQMYAAQQAAMMPKKQIQMAPDGTINVNIYEDALRYFLSDKDDILTESNSEDMRFGLTAKERELAHGDALVARKRFDPDYILGKAAGLKSATILPLLLSGPTFGLSLIVGDVNKANNEHLLRSDAFKELKKAVEKDPECAKLIKRINAELMNKDPDKATLKTLKAHLIENIDRVKFELKKKAESESLKESLIRETPRCGLIESLAVNAASNMLKEGKEYNPDLALADAIMSVTITEALDEMGILVVNANGYKNVTEAAGGKYSLEEARKPAGSLLNKNVEANLKTLKAQHKPLNESVICAQEAPRMNSASNSDSLAERIRQKKLLKEDNHTLHD